MKSISVVMPAYNEAQNIGAMLQDVLQTMNALTTEFEVVIVNDGSCDETPQVIKSFIKQHPQVRLLEHVFNEGYGAAVCNGMNHSKKEWIFLTDSDRQFDLQEICNLFDFMEEADLVIGYRAPRRDPLMRRLNGRGWSLLVTLLFGYTARDVDCAFKLIRRKVIDFLKNDISSRGATFSAELLVRAKRAGFRIRELPVHGHRPRVVGSPSGGRPYVIFRAFKELLKFRMTLWREARQRVQKRPHHKNNIFSDKNKNHQSKEI